MNQPSLKSQVPLWLLAAAGLTLMCVGVANDTPGMFKLGFIAALAGTMFHFAPHWSAFLPRPLLHITGIVFLLGTSALLLAAFVPDLLSWVATFRVTVLACLALLLVARIWGHIRGAKTVSAHVV